MTDKQKTNQLDNPRQTINPNAEGRSKRPILNEQFKNNPLIQKMNKIKRWTISDDDKQPVNAVYFLQTEQVRLFKQNQLPDGRVDVNDHSQLVTLDEIDANPNLTFVNRAFRFMDAAKTRNPIICIDLEKTAPEELVQELMGLPAHFAEYSKSGGFHILIEVPSFCITAKTRYLFNLTVFKDPLNEFEVIFNRHFVTFTKKCIARPTPDFSSPDTIASIRLIKFLEGIAKMDENNARVRRQKEEQRAKAQRIYDLEELPQQIDALTEHLPAEYVEELEQLTPNDYYGDNSKYEYNIAVKLIGKMMYNIDNSEDIFLPSQLGMAVKDLSPWDYAYAAHEVMCAILQEREKHSEQREGLPWLLYLARDAALYVNARNEDDKKKGKPKRKPTR